MAGLFCCMMVRSANINTLSQRTPGPILRVAADRTMGQRLFLTWLPGGFDLRRRARFNPPPSSLQGTLSPHKRLFVIQLRSDNPFDLPVSRGGYRKVPVLCKPKHLFKVAGIFSSRIQFSLNLLLYRSVQIHRILRPLFSFGLMFSGRWSVHRPATRRLLPRGPSIRILSRHQACGQRSPTSQRTSAHKHRPTAKHPADPA
jgi:hypothetical protein